MATAAQLEEKLWKAIESDRTMMLGLDGVEDGHARPMTAQIEGPHGPIWFFTTKENGLVRSIGLRDRAIATFASKGHDLFATVHGTLSISNDRAAIDRLWNRFVAAWYEGGKDDPSLALLRLDPESAEIWENATGLYPAIKLLLGSNPRKEYKEKVATVALD